MSKYGWFIRRVRAVLALLCGANPAELCAACGAYCEDGYFIKLDDGRTSFFHKPCAEDIFEVEVTERST